MESYLTNVVRAIVVKLLLGSGGVETIDIEGIFPGVDKLFQPAASGLVADIFKRELGRMVEADKRPSPLIFVIIDYFGAGEVGIKPGAVDAFGVCRLGRDERTGWGRGETGSRPNKIQSNKAEK